MALPGGFETLIVRVIISFVFDFLVYVGVVRAVFAAAGLLNSPRLTVYNLSHVVPRVKCT